MPKLKNTARLPSERIASDKDDIVTAKSAYPMPTVTEIQAVRQVFPDASPWAECNSTPSWSANTKNQPGIV